MRYKFGDIIYNITEKRKPTEEDRLNYIGLEHLDSCNLFVTRWGAERTPEGEKIVMKKGDVLFGKRRAYQKKVAISPIDGVFSAHGMVLRPKEDVICKEFLPFFISSDTFLNEAIRISVGGLSPTINWKDIKELEFDLPSLDEQKVLAEKLWAAYEVKQSYLKMIDATQEMVKAQFIEMFGTVSSPKVEVMKLIDVVCASGQYGSNTSAVDYIEGSPRYIRITDINEDGSLNDDVKSAEIYEDKYLLQKDDMVFARTGATVGKTYLHENGTAIYAGYLIKYHPNECLVRSKYLKAFTHSDTYYNWVNKTQKVGAQPNISATQYDGMPILVPSLENQDTYIMIYNQADKSISELRKSIDAIDKFIKSLINENL